MDKDENSEFSIGFLNSGKWDSLKKIKTSKKKKDDNKKIVAKVQMFTSKEKAYTVQEHLDRLELEAFLKVNEKFNDIILKKLKISTKNIKLLFRKSESFFEKRFSKHRI